MDATFIIVKENAQTGSINGEYSGYYCDDAKVVDLDISMELAHISEQQKRIIISDIKQQLGD